MDTDIIYKAVAAPPEVLAQLQGAKAVKLVSMTHFDAIYIAGNALTFCYIEFELVPDRALRNLSGLWLVA